MTVLQGAILATPYYQTAQQCLAQRDLYTEREIAFLEAILPNGYVTEAQADWLADLARRERIDFDKINDAARSVLTALLHRWLPDGKQHGKEWVALNPLRGDTRPGSFRINIYSGKWADFATPHRGGDPVSLAAYLHHSDDQVAAAKALKEMLGA